LPELIYCERLVFAGAIRTGRENIGRAVGKMNAGAGHRNEHDLAREIAGGMPHRLIGGGDPARSGVIVNAEVDASAAAFRGLDQRMQTEPALAIDDRLRGLDHWLDLQRGGLEIVFSLEDFKEPDRGPRS